MQAAKTIGSTRRALSPAARVPLEPPAIAQLRQDYLDALPIATALILDTPAGPELGAANRQFDALDAQSRASGGERLIERHRLREAIAGFLPGEAPELRLEWCDGETVGGRHFVICLSRLPSTADHARRCLLTLVDRTVEVENERSLRAEMLHDSLTGLPNRAAFAEAVEAAAAEAGGAGFAVLVVDLIRFSRINECMGPIAGDELIITVARRLVSSLRSNDLLARIGGDEFGILLALRDGPDDALHAARRILAALSTPFRLSELEIGIDCAIGCAMMSDSAVHSDEVVRNAQFALKRAKRSGQVEVYHPGEANAVRRRFSVETELRRAIERDELELAYQPVIDLATGAVNGFEALARWTHADRGVVQPTEFIAVAEECGLIVPLGRWAVDAALRTLAEWDRRAGREVPIHMAVNLSAVQLVRDDVAPMVAAALATHRVGGRRLILELTESAIVQDPERATRTLQALKELDASVAMDDFGTGYSSMAYLQRLPIDILKIDRSFVTDMLADRDKVAIVRAVLGLADALGMSTTAEGVETMQLAQTLGALGCNHGQGFHFAEPMKSAAAFAYLASRSA